MEATTRGINAEAAEIPATSERIKTVVARTNTTTDRTLHLLAALDGDISDILAGARRVCRLADGTDDTLSGGVLGGLALGAGHSGECP